MAQNSSVPAFESFSFNRDPQFGGNAVQSGDMAAECSALSTPEQVQLELALDKALSQILKLTIDYEALRTRIESAGIPADDADEGWFLFGESRQESSAKLQELLNLHNEQLADRDKEINRLTARQMDLQTRYDIENEKRLAAEKQLQKTSRKAVVANDDLLSTEVNALKQQVDKYQADVQNLTSDLADEKLKNARLNAIQAKQALSSVGGDSNKTLTGVISAGQFVPAIERVLDGLEFASGSANIELDSTENLGELIETMKQKSSLKVQISGYTDSRGAAKSNLKLSQERAESVATYLALQGIDPQRIHALGYGERRPVADNKTEQGRNKNRRVAVLLFE